MAGNLASVNQNSSCRDGCAEEQEVGQAKLSAEEKKLVLDTCVKLFPAWSASPPEVEDVTFQMIQGGITNELIRVCAGDKSVLFRRFGAKTDLIIDRDREYVVFQQLTELKFGPKLYGVSDTKQCRVEEWLNGHALKPDEMRDSNMQRLIARRLAEMHVLPIQNIDKSPTLWHTLEQWMKVALNIQFADAAKQARYEALDLPGINAEMKTYQNKLSQHDIYKNSPVVFSHNDLLSGNILYGDGNVVFIDFEYGSYNYRGFDIANHFCEYCGFDCDWSTFPTRSSQRNFLKAYVEAMGSDEDDIESAVDQLYVEVQGYVLAPHLFWGVWALVQAKYSPIEFDFLEYAEQRLGGFKAFKNRSYENIDSQD